MKISAKWQKFNCLWIFRIFYSVIWTLWHESINLHSVVISSPCVYFMQTHVALLPVKLGAVAWSRNKKVRLALWGLTCYSCEHLLKFLWGATWSGYQCQAKHPADAYLFFQRIHKIEQKMKKMWDQLHSQMRELLIHFTFSFLIWIHLRSLILHTDTVWYWDNIESLPSRCLNTVLSVLHVACHLIISTVLWSRYFYMQLWGNELREWKFSNKSWYMGLNLGSDRD